LRNLGPIWQARLGGARADPGEREQERERSDENDPTLNPACHPGYLLVLGNGRLAPGASRAYTRGDQHATHWAAVELGRTPIYRGGFLIEDHETEVALGLVRMARAGGLVARGSREGGDWRGPAAA